MEIGRKIKTGRKIWMKDTKKRQMDVKTEGRKNRNSREIWKFRKK